MQDAKVLFLFKSGRKARLNENGPREFFYGFTEMQRLGVNAELFEETDFPNPPLDGFAERLATRLLMPITGLNARTLAYFSRAPILDRLNSAAVLVATTNSQGLALGALRAVGRLRTPVLFLPMGVLIGSDDSIRRSFQKRWLRHTHLAPISRGEQVWLETQLAASGSTAYLPFGVDCRYWTPAPEEGARPYAFAIGNDFHRDWMTLANAWSQMMPPLRIVTRLPVPPMSGNVEILAGDWNSRPISDATIRDFYRKSCFVLLPIQQTIQPSGQSACLQAMACGKAVILSAIHGLWDDEILKDGETCLLVPPGDAKALAEGVQRLAADPALARRIGLAARAIVETRFNVERMGETMAERLRGIVG